MAAMTSITISFLTTPTTTTTNSILPFNYSITKSKKSKVIKYIDKFTLKCTPTNINSSVISPSLSDVSDSLESACDVVRTFYDGINSRNLSIIVDLIADDCVYEDLVFPQPFVGREAILEFFEKFINTISQDLQFVIDDISGEDTSAVGVTWHLEWKGKPFPFSKGCSFYRLKVLDGRRQIIYARDIVEPAVKPGDFALGAIRGVTWLLEQFPQLADRF